jgi:uncharacterized protein (DUF2141 family)
MSVGIALLLAAFVGTSPSLGKAEGQCRAGETGPAFLVDVIGLKDRVGLLKLEVYPNNDKDFLEDDNVLVNAHKTFRRVEEPVPQGANVQLCIRVPAPGPYSVSLLHDRDSTHKFAWTIDGIGFASNPHLGWFKPKSEATRAFAGPGLTHIQIVLNYRSGLGVAPLKEFRVKR